jgi:hypothetical protein
MTTTETRRADDGLQERLTEIELAHLLPLFARSLDRFTARYEANGETRQVFAHVDDFVAVAIAFITPEVEAADPPIHGCYLQFLESEHRGWQAGAALLFLNILTEHPELVTVLVDRLTAALRREVFSDTVRAEARETLLKVREANHE